jgi:hypothetical protein
MLDLLLDILKLKDIVGKERGHRENFGQGHHFL